MMSVQKEIVSGAPDSEPPLVLFVCRKNEAASILAEAILRHLAQGRIRSASVGHRFTY
jgi:protein-tyrosine-phosphatase